MNKKRIITGFLLLGLFCFSSLAHADKSLVIVRGQDFPPYHYLDETGKIKGFVVELISETAGQMGIEISFEQYPWSRCINMMEKGYADGMMNLFKTEKREIFMSFSDNILAYETNTFFTLKTSDILYSGDLITIFPYKIGTIRNYSYGKRFDTLKLPFNFRMETEKELINSLINKRCDLIIGNKLALQTLLFRNNLQDRIKYLSPDVSRDPLYIGFSKIKGHTALSSSFSKHLKQFKASNAYQIILEKYGVQTP